MTAPSFKENAARCRRLATHGSLHPLDPLRKALLEMAEDFERQAAAAEATEGARSAQAAHDHRV